MPVNERSDWTEMSTASIRTSRGCVRGSVEEVASLHAAKTKGNRPRTVTNGTARRVSMETSRKATASIDVLAMADRCGIDSLRYVPKNQLDLSRLLFHCYAPY